MDMAMAYERHQQEESQPGYIPPVSVEDLMKIKEQA